MRYKTKADLIEKITENVRKRINSRERTIYKTDVRHVVDALIEEGRNMVIEGDTLTVRGLLTISLQDPRWSLPVISVENRQSIASATPKPSRYALVVLSKKPSRRGIRAGR